MGIFYRPPSGSIWKIGSDSVLGLANDSGSLVARFRYDGFGNPRSEAGLSDPAATELPTDAGGDFRFHGAWLEAETGFYHMRARDYDPETGRFLERDPWEGDIKTPETLHAYAFANNNPYYYSDPSGEFTVVEINVSGSIQSGMQGFRTVAIQRAKGYAQDKIVDAFSNAAVRALEHFYPEAGKLVNIFGGLFDAKASGLNHENQVLRFVCNNVSGGVARYLWLYPASLRPEQRSITGFIAHRKDSPKSGQAFTVPISFSERMHRPTFP